ncbi:hypothetical protein NVIE_024100 [Nitrososphaera viennensis EN76]|uniref:Uncharacterized protein n=1 Tax=Nitrososphaera viennensis EN76 TaxID=926571 RepID=A0A060HMG0_9ARCH|nr:hypothetical protein NVIE_024100 [Nitrososphaera viennensis EN76]
MGMMMITMVENYRKSCNVFEYDFAKLFAA